jgi:hypothetical protein
LSGNAVRGYCRCGLNTKGNMNIIDFGSVLRSRDAGYIAQLDAIRACDAIRAHLLGDAPMAADELAEALETIKSFVAEA